MKGKIYIQTISSPFIPQKAQINFGGILGELGDGSGPSDMMLSIFFPTTLEDEQSP